MKGKSFLLYLGASLCAHYAIAGTMGPATGQLGQAFSWVGTISGGPTWQKEGSAQSIYLTPEIEKSYVPNKSSHTLLGGEVFLGIQKSLSPSVDGQLGLAVAATSSRNLSGVIWDDADSEFDNFTYGYKIRHTYVAAKAKLLLNQDYWLIPWVSGSMGLGFNRSSSFHSTPRIYEAVPTPDFKSNTQTAFSYTLGAGVQKALDRHWQVGAGYEFSAWGKTSLGRAVGQTVNSGPSFNHPHTNGLMFNLTYIA